MGDAERCTTCVLDVTSLAHVLPANKQCCTAPPGAGFSLEGRVCFWQLHETIPSSPPHTFRQALLVGGGHAPHHQQLLHCRFLPCQRLPAETEGRGEVGMKGGAALQV